MKYSKTSIYVNYFVISNWFPNFSNIENNTNATSSFFFISELFMSLKYNGAIWFSDGTSKFFMPYFQNRP